MRSRVGAVAPWAVLSLTAATAFLLGRLDREERNHAFAERQQQAALLALSAKLERVSDKLEAASLSLSFSRNEQAERSNALVPASSPSAGLEPIAPAAGAGNTPSPPAEVDAQSAERLANAWRELDDGVRLGHWTRASGQRFEAALSGLDGDLRQQAMARFSQEVNAGHLIPEDGAFPF